MRYGPVPDVRLAVTVSAVRLRWRRPGLLVDDAMSTASTVLAVVLSVAMVVLILGQRGGGVAAACVAVAMTAPVTYARLAPTAAGVSIAIAAGVNELFFGHLIRCGAALPAAFLIAFVAGYARRRLGLVALAGTALSAVIQCLFDPRLGAGVIALMLPVDLVFFLAGVYVGGRAAMVASLRTSTAELYEQRERTARLAVVADREELTGRLNHTLHHRMDALKNATCGGGGSQARFATIEKLGRQTLDEMRELLGSLRESPTRPEPRLADLADVCARASSADVRLTVDGAHRALPASIELSACRIVEQLLRMLPDEPAAEVQLHVAVAAAGIDIVVSGAPASAADLQHIRALTQARASLHGGSAAISDQAGERRAQVWLPLVTAHG
jgi:signal transduction histidine kinase